MPRAECADLLALLRTDIIVVLMITGPQEVENRSMKKYITKSLKS